MNKFDFIFWGTPEVAKKTLEILNKNGYTPSLIITAPDKPSGRKMIITPPEVKTWAIENNIPYLQPEKLDKEFIDKLKEKKFILSIVVAYGKIIPEEILNLPQKGSINIHFSLLPKYRGASPVESAILNGDEETGVSIQKMEYKMDSGPIIASEKTNIDRDEKINELKERLTHLGGELLVRILPEFMEDKITPMVQDENLATFSRKIKKEDGLIDLDADPQKNYNKFRAYFVWPRTFFFKDGKRIIITKAKLENEKFIIEKVIPEGKKEVPFTDIQRL
jgi:methionyl-tRNA formyltransferase